MVFLLQNSLVAAIVAAPSADLVNALQHLADGRRCGQNEVLGDRDVLRAASQCEQLSAPARAVYHRLAESSTRMLGLLAECSFCVEVTHEPLVCRQERHGNQQRIVISVEHLANHQSLSRPPLLLCENLDDCDFMIWIALIYCHKKRLPGYVQFSKRNGGGSTTAPGFEDILSRREELCLCICDSDRDYEGDTTFGNTAEALRDVEARCSTPFGHLHILNCQEAENLIPASVLADVYPRDPHKLQAAADLESIQRNAAVELWRYYDVKNGIRVFEFVMSPHLAYQRSWARVFGAAGDATNSFCPSCSASMQCSNKAECASYIVKGFGATALRDVLGEFFAKKPNAEIIRRLRQPIKSEWEALGALIWSWGAAGGRIAA